jgi:hypothetical protein
LTHALALCPSNTTLTCRLGAARIDRDHPVLGRYRTGWIRDSVLLSVG